ncbi:hypothetical protein HQ403_00445 [Candidatus Kaiserbacteria bacterium]|nr:hypothetical protein [Candidatus Kaiserbacteria bacterium]
MIEVIPAIMPDSYDDFLQKAGRVKGIVSCAQVDVMDGKFVPSISWPYDKKGLAQFKTMVDQGDMLPFWDEVDYEIDLMVETPEDVIEDWIALGARRVIVHVASAVNLKKIIELLEERHGQAEDLEGVAPVELGVALGVEDSLNTLEPFIHNIDVVQFMGIKRIGYQGEPYDERIIPKIESLREEHPHLIISVDGGVSLETAPNLIKAGASRLVSGSTIFKSSDIREVIFKLKHS